MRHRPSRFALGLLLFAGSSTAFAADTAPCSPLDLGFGSGSGWSHRPLSKLKRDTAYSLLTEDKGGSILQAVADNSASLYIRPIDKAPATAATLSWRWKTDALVPGADNRDRKREDAPLRVIAAFDGDRSKLTQAERERFNRAKRLSGVEPPYATLMYIWSEQVPVETLIPSAHSSRLKMIVVASGATGLGQWQTVERRLAEDFKRSFGEPPGPLVGVAVMTDTDNTGTKASGSYADIRLTCAGT
jgi:hypothetical protein